MFDNIEIFGMAQSMARHAAAQQGTVARNVANADTPGYRARDVAPFAETYAPYAGHAMRATRPGHVSGVDGFTPARIPPRDAQGAHSPNGNSVSLEQEMVRAAEARGQHNMALSIYRTATSIWRASLGR